MAKVNYGTIVNDARGKVNGTVFSKNKSGAYTRRKVTPANPNTPRQSTVRTTFGTLSKVWSGTLTESERATWIAFANTYPRLDVFGNSITLTGLNMFISLSAVLSNLGNVPSSTAPASNVVTPINFDPLSLAAVAATPLVTFQQLTISSDPNSRYYIFAARPLPAGRQPADSDFRFIGFLGAQPAPFPATVDVTTIYAAKFGTFSAGQRISLLVATVDFLTGLTTIGAKMSVIAT